MKLRMIRIIFLAEPFYMICNVRIATPAYAKIILFAIYNKSGLSLIYAKFSHIFQKCILESIQKL